MQNGPIEIAEVTIQYINPPREGKSWGNVKATDGQQFWGPPAMLAQYKTGESCKIEFTFSKDGKFKNLHHKIEVPKAMQRPVPALPRAPTNPQDSERMGAQGMVNAFIAAGHVTLQRDAIKAAIKECHEAYNDHWGNPTKQASQQEFNDEIPY